MLRELGDRGIGARAYFDCIHLLEPYRQRFGWRPGQFPVAERFARQNLALPFYPDIGADQQQLVREQLVAAIAKVRSKGR